MRAFVLMLCVACAADGDGDGDGEIYDTGLTDLGPADCEGFTGTQHDDLGSGSKEDPFVLCNVDQLVSLREDDPFVGRKTHYLLGADIDLAGVDFGSGIAFCNDVFPDPVGGFKGTLDGGGHTVSNLTIDSRGRFAGLIGCLNGGTIRDIVFDAPRVIWSGGASLLDGYYYGVAAGYAYDATFEDIVVHDGVVTGYHGVGGIVGTARGSMFARVGFEGQVGGEPQSGYGGELHGAGTVGGIAGLNEWSSMWDSYATGSVKGERLIGGLFGAVNAGGVGTVVCRSYAATEIALLGADENPRPGILVGTVQLGEPLFGAVQGGGECATTSADWTVFGLLSDDSDATEMSGEGELGGSTQAETFDALCQAETYEAAGWDLVDGAWNPPTGDAPPTLRD